jgi:ferredoxin--NADP+ reductase
MEASMIVAPIQAEPLVESLRQKHYNACVAQRIDVHEDLMILRIQPDGGMPSFAAGQYTVLGLGNWEERVPGCQQETPDDNDRQKLLKRAYSFSCSMLDDQGRVRRPSDFPYLEFYVVLVRRGEEHPPGLTPRIFGLADGDRLFIGPKATGHYTLAAVQPDDDVVLIATGTGEAPHNAMAAELLAAGHRGQIVSITCARKLRDLGYLATHRRLEALAPNYRYLTLTTREDINLDSTRPDFVGKRYLQEFFSSGDFERATGVPLEPARTHVFLCGNPAMIGIPHADAAGAQVFPSPTGMIEILIGRGFRMDERGQPGNVHFEKYW